MVRSVKLEEEEIEKIKSALIEEEDRFGRSALITKIIEKLKKRKRKREI